MENLHCVLLWLRHLVIIILREHLVLLQENVKNWTVQILQLHRLKIPFQDIDPDDRINMSVQKGLTGNDNYFVCM